MLSAADNALLTQTGPGTPMGAYFRHFWQPVALSRELPEADCAPIRVRILGEDLVAFRDTNGRRFSARPNPSSNLIPSLPHQPHRYRPSPRYACVGPNREGAYPAKAGFPIHFKPATSARSIWRKLSASNWLAEVIEGIGFEEGLGPAENRRLKSSGHSF